MPFSAPPSSWCAAGSHAGELCADDQVRGVDDREHRTACDVDDDQCLEPGFARRDLEEVAGNDHRPEQSQ